MSVHYTKNGYDVIEDEDNQYLRLEDDKLIIEGFDGRTDPHMAFTYKPSGKKLELRGEALERMKKSMHIFGGAAPILCYFEDSTFRQTVDSTNGATVCNNPASFYVAGSSLVH